jgi:6-carboxyhexanoate--CoA ligase
MNGNSIYSIRMRASVAGRHISGAERIVPIDKINATLQELALRANSRGSTPDQVILKIESLDNSRIRNLTSLDLVTVNVSDMSTGRSVASRILQTAGVSAQAVERALSCLSNGASPSRGNMRGAIVMDAITGERLEPDQERGVRVSRFDWGEDAADKIDKQLAEIGLTHFRTREALALATKVAHAPCMVAELCWSDEPGYVAGYVASRTFGYIRFPNLKQHGDPRGGRVFFVNRGNSDLDAVIQYLQMDAVLIDAIGNCRPAMTSAEYFDCGKTGAKEHVCSNKICQY